MEKNSINDKGSEPKTPKGVAKMNRAKAAAVSAEKRLREVATWELTQGNRRKTTPDEIFAMACNLRHQIDVGIWASLDELETTVFSRWALGSTSTLTEEMSFANLDPVGGG